MTELPPFVQASDTSLDAAIRAIPLAARYKTMIFALLRASPGGFTDEAMQRILSIPASTQRPRRVELVRVGLVRDSGRRQPTLSGRRAVVWEARTAQDAPGSAQGGLLVP